MIGWIPDSWSNIRLWATPLVGTSQVTINQGVLFQATWSDVTAMISDFRQMKYTQADLQSNTPLDQRVVMKFQGSMYPSLVSPVRFTLAVDRLRNHPRVAAQVFPFLLYACVTPAASLTIAQEVDPWAVLSLADIQSDVKILTEVVNQLGLLMSISLTHADVRLPNIIIRGGKTQLVDIESVTGDLPSVPLDAGCEPLTHAAGIDKEGLACWQISLILYQAFAQNPLEFKSFVKWLDKHAARIPIIGHAKRALSNEFEGDFTNDALRSLPMFSVGM